MQYKDGAVDGTVSLQDTYAEILIPSTSECD